MEMALHAFVATLVGLGAIALWSPAWAQTHAYTDAPARAAAYTGCGCPRHWRHARQVYYAPSRQSPVVGGAVDAGTIVVGGVTQPFFGPYDNYSWRIASAPVGASPYRSSGYGP